MAVSFNLYYYEKGQKNSLHYTKSGYFPLLHFVILKGRVHFRGRKAANIS